MEKIIEGVVHGRTIELLGDPGVAEGQKVQVVLFQPSAEGALGEGIRRTAGALADDPQWDEIMAEVQRGRKLRTPPAVGGGMNFLLDTNICSAHMRRPGGLAHQFFQHAGGLAIPSVVLGELYAGAYRHPNPPRLLALIADLLQELQVLDFDAACAEQFGKLYGSLLRQGILVSSADLMIASVALVHDLTLVTHNTSDFQNVTGLRLADWLVP